MLYWFWVWLYGWKFSDRCEQCGTMFKARSLSKKSVDRAAELWLERHREFHVGDNQ